jgi:phosphoribosylformylglycinamidine synthase
VAGNSPLFQRLKGQYRIPVSHSEGNFRADDETLKRLEGDGRVALRYLNNPNGSINDIAGILSENGRVLGMMPHPERATDPRNGRTDGRAILEAYLQSLTLTV